MKYPFILATAMSLAAIAAYGENTADTTAGGANPRLVFYAPDSVVVNNGNDALSVEIFDKDNSYHSFSRANNNRTVIRESDNSWNFSIPFVDHKPESHSSNPDFSFEVGGIAFGFVNALNASDGMKVDMAASYEILADHILQLRCNWNRSTSMAIGFGIAWRNYRMTGNQCFNQDGSMLSVGPYPEGVNPKFSRIKIFSLTIPLRFYQELGKGFGFYAGPVLNINTHASFKTRYEHDGSKVDLKSSDIHQRKVTVDLMAGITFKAIGAYVKYSPCSMLVSDFGPEFNHFSAGLSLFY